jgi:SAM-dependent methyltransferase
MLAEAAAACEEAGITIARRAQADATALPFADGAFDLVFANHMLYHVPDADRPRAIAEIRRVLAPRGALLAATNGRDHMRELIDLVQQVGGRDALDSVAGSGSSAGGFLLEDAATQLGPYFDDVSLERYDSGLEVDEVEPLVDYALSVGSWAKALAGREQAFRNVIAERIATEGMVRIRKDVGVAVARRDPG